VARTEGTWVEPAGGTVLATLRRLRRTGAVRRHDTTVAFLTGAGWKSSLHPPAEGPSARTVHVDPSRPELERLSLGSTSLAGGGGR
jgi:threonine synthase